VWIWWAPEYPAHSTLCCADYVSYLVLRRFSDSAQTQKLAAVAGGFWSARCSVVYFSICSFARSILSGDAAAMGSRMLISSAELDGVSVLRVSGV